VKAAGALVIAAAGVLLPAAAFAAESAGPVWTLQALGRPALDLPVGQPVDEVTLPFDAPPGTRQGSGSWYVGRLDFELELDPASRGGLVYLSLSTNGRASVMVKVQTSRRAHRLHVRWSTVDLFHGRREHVSHSARIAASASNFLQDRGIQGGQNTLGFRLERYGGARVRSARVRESSGVVVTPKGPARLRLEVPVRDRNLQVGDEFSVPYRVTNVGDRAPQSVRISAQFDADMLVPVGPVARRLEPRAHLNEGRFRFRARRAGTTDVMVAVRSTANRPGAQVSVRIDAPPAAGAVSAWWKGLGATGLVLLAAAAVVAFAGSGRRSASAREGRA
jgi:hypothetical protein